MCGGSLTNHCPEPDEEEEVMPVTQSVNITINNSDTQGQRQKQEQSEGDFSPGNSGNNDKDLVIEPVEVVVVSSTERDVD